MPVATEKGKPMVNVDITTQVQRVQTPTAPAHRPADPHVPDQAPAIQDQVDISSSGKKALKEFLEGQTIAEAWLKHIIDPSQQQTQKSSDSNPNQDPKDGSNKGFRDQTQNALGLMMDDIKWLLDALGIDPTNTDRLFLAVHSRAQVDLGSSDGAVAIQATAPTATVPALFVEDISLTVHKGDLTDASVKKVSVTAVHGSNSDSIAGQVQPMVIDLGGQLPAVAPNASKQGGSQPDKAEDIFRTGTSPTDLRYSVAPAEVRHGMLIIREGGRPQPDNTVKLRLDALMPLSSL
ncbi:MAG: hypothetical protein ACM31L_06690 [Actinomycetota bacterium]